MTKGKRKLHREEVKIIRAEIPNREKFKLWERWRSPTGAFGALALTYMSHLRRSSGWVGPREPGFQPGLIWGRPFGASRWVRVIRQGWCFFVSGLNAFSIGGIGLRRPRVGPLRAQPWALRTKHLWCLGPTSGHPFGATCLVAFVFHVCALAVAVADEVFAEVFVEHLSEVGLEVGVAVRFAGHEHEVEALVGADQGVH